MKKSLKFFSLLIALLVIMTGCDTTKKDAKEQLEDAIKKTSESKGITLKLDASMEATAEGTTMTVSLGMNGDYYNDDTPTSHFTTNVSLLGMSQEMEMYTEVKDGYNYTYTKSGDKWTYTKSEYKKEETSTEQIKEVLDNAKSVKEEKTDKKGYTKLVVTVDKDKINEAMKDESISSLVSDDTKINSDITMNVYLKDGYVSIIEMDLGNVLKDALADSEDSSDANVKATITIEMSNFNKVDKISVPEDVTKNATEETDSDLSDSLLSE